jgi:heme-degrading monooxygenase HmoA
MYGTVARLKVLPGKEEDFLNYGKSLAGLNIPGWVATATYRADAGDGEYWLAVVFESREAYRANADSPEQDARYREMRALLAADPEWNDGEVVSRITASG